MSSYIIYDQQGTYFVTLQIIDWVDLFSRKTYRDLFIESLKYCCENKGLEVFAYVIMSNHVHLIVRTKNELSAVIRDMKKYTAVRFLETIQNEPESRREWILHRFSYNASKHKRNHQYQVWTHENHAEEIRTRDFFLQKREYIHYNPVRAGLVEFPEEYLYSSARNYVGKKGLIPVEVVDG